MPPLIADGGRWTVSGVYTRLVGQGEQFRLDTVDKLLVVSTGKIGSSDRACKQGIA